MKKWASAALKHNFGELIMAFDEQGTPLSGGLFLNDDRCCYYAFGASDPDFRPIGAGTLVVLEAIQRAWKRGLSQFDFCGVNSPKRGDFKASFNAALKEPCRSKPSGVLGQP